MQNQIHGQHVRLRACGRFDKEKDGLLELLDQPSLKSQTVAGFNRRVDSSTLLKD
jgi:hypothetical protein